MWTREQLAARVAAGEPAEFLFFWGHTPGSSGAVDRSCLSQWFERGFTIDGARYPTAEHWMMAAKARLFADEESLARILAAPSPAEAKAAGRGVTPFDAARWSAVCVDAVVQGNVAKFSQHADLCAFLLATGDRVLVEAAPRDLIWGVGLSASNPLAREPAKWRGRNLLGFALMETRERMRRA